MKSIRIAGLCLAAVFVMSMVAAGSASAVERVWEHCTNENVSSIPTKYSGHQCLAVGGSNEWAWRTVEGTEKVVSHGSLVLADTKVPIAGRVEVQCTGENAGVVGPKKFDRVEAITNIQCVAGKGCEKLEEPAKPLNLPWQTELVEEANGEIRNKIRATNGAGAGWSVKCRVLGVVKLDDCTTEEGHTKAENKVTPGVEGSLLVLMTFDKNSPNAKCEVGGAGSGEVRGTIAVLQANGWGLRIS